MGFRIDFDPVVAHGRVDLLTGCLGNNHGGCFDGHVAVDAIGSARRTQLFSYSATLPLMACQAFCGVTGGGLFWCVGVVACRAGHRG